MTYGYRTSGSRRRRALLDALGSLGMIGDMLERAADPHFDVSRPHRTPFANEPDDFVQLRERQSREDEPHRCLANTASTSSALATSPRRTAARASSILASSSRVAR